jgi:uncharacterized lipoprotein
METGANKSEEDRADEVDTDEREHKQTVWSEPATVAEEEVQLRRREVKRRECLTAAAENAKSWALCCLKAQEPFDQNWMMDVKGKVTS